MHTESSTLNSPAEDPSLNKDSDDDEVGGLHIGKTEAEVSASQVAPRWPTRVFAINCLLKVMASCEGDEVHFDLSLAKQLQLRNKGEVTLLCYRLLVPYVRFPIVCLWILCDAVCWC